MYTASSTPITMRLPSRLSVFTRFPTTEDSGGVTVRSTNGLSTRAPRISWPRIRGSKRFDVDGDVG